MIRRSKLKVRPAVRRPASAAKPSGDKPNTNRVDTCSNTDEPSAKQADQKLPEDVPVSSSQGESLPEQIQDTPEQQPSQEPAPASKEDPLQSGAVDPVKTPVGNSVTPETTAGTQNELPAEAVENHSGMVTLPFQDTTPPKNEGMDENAARDGENTPAGGGNESVAGGGKSTPDSGNATPKPAAPKGRRRKLVACPQMARKRAKTTASDSERPSKRLKKPDPPLVQKPDPQPESVADVPYVPDMGSIVPAVQVIEPVPDCGQQSICDDSGATEHDLTPLTTVRSNPTPVQNSSPADVTPPTPLPLKDAEPAEAQPGDSDLPQNKTDSAVKVTPVITVPPANKQPPKQSKPKTTTEINRIKAVKKMKKALEKQEGDIKAWPEMDHNFFSMSDLIYLNPPKGEALTLGMNTQKENPNETVITPVSGGSSQGSGTSSQQSTTSADTTASGSVVEDNEEETALPVPQIRIAEDGTVVIDEESIVMDTEKPPDPKIKTVYEFGREGTINQCSFMRRPIPRTSRWSEEETNKFYKCLCIVGAEFSLMGAMFRGRSPDDLRRKYRRERKKNPMRVDKALMQQHLSKWTDDMFEPKTVEVEEDSQPKGDQNAVT